MSKQGVADGIDLFFREITSLQADVIGNQRQKLADTAAVMAATIAQEGRIFIFGTGHSHMMAEEAFFRAGGLAPVVPIFSTALMLHENPSFSSVLERSEGLAGVLLDTYQVRQDEMIFIFSNSGVNRMPVEMAIQARQRGLFVVSISSLTYAREAPLSRLGKRLDEIAAISIDNGGKPGDALVEIDGINWLVGASSTIIGALIWNCLLVECVKCLQADGITPPVFASHNMPTANDYNQTLLRKWRRVNPHL